MSWWSGGHGGQLGQVVRVVMVVSLVMVISLVMVVSLVRVVSCDLYIIAIISPLEPEKFFLTSLIHVIYIFNIDFFLEAMIYT